MLFTIFSGRIRYGVKAPDFLTVLCIIGRDIAAHTHFRATIANHHQSANHARGSSDCIGFGLINRERRPNLLSRIPVKCDQTAIKCAEKQAIAPCRQAAIDDITASLDRRFSGNFRVIFPK